MTSHTQIGRADVPYPGPDGMWRGRAAQQFRLLKDFLLLLLVEPVRSFQRNDGLQKAGMLAYYTFMSFIPLFLALMLMGGRLISSETAVRVLEQLVGQLLPQSKELVLREVTGLAEQKAWSMLSLVVLFWWMIPVATVLRVTFATIFKTSVRVFQIRAPGPVAFVLGKLYDMVALLLIVGLMAVLTGTGWVYTLADRLIGDHVPILRTLMNWGIPNLTAFLCLFVFFILFVPDRRHPVAILIGTAVTAVFLKLMNPIFSLMLVFNPDYGYMFGSLKAIFLFFIWIYFASASILIGAEVMSCLYRRHELVMRDHVMKLLRGIGETPRYRHLVRSVTRTLARGELLFRQGEAGKELFIVAGGRVAMVRNGQTVSVAGPGQSFGEVGALLGMPRLADAVVESEEAEVVALPPANLTDPELLLKLLEDMARRLVRRENGDLPVDLDPSPDPLSVTPPR